MNYQTQYKELVLNILKQPLVHNERTSTKIQIARGTQVLRAWGASIPLIGGRHIWFHSAAAEVAWYLSGTKNCNWLNSHTKMWTRWQDENKDVNAAYGYRWRNYHGVDQINAAITNLKKDPTSRRIWIDTWAPEEDSQLDANNTPCPLGFNLQIYNGQLNMSVVMRSSDVAVGLIYDTISFKILHNAFAGELKILPGDFEMVLLNAHIYQPQVPTLQKILNDSGLDDHKFMQESDWSISEIIASPDEFVDNINQKHNYLNRGKPKLEMYVAT